MLVMVRHGKTGSNTPGEERLRGWLPLGLTIEGMKEAHDAAEMLEGLDGVHQVSCSDLPRTVQSGHEVARVLGKELKPMHELRDINTGDLAGEKVDPALIKKIHGYINSPDKKIPGGESFQQWYNHIIPVLREMVESKDLHVSILHGRIATLLMALAKTKGKYPDTDTLMGKPPIDPGGVMVIDSEWNVPFKTVKKESNNRLS